MLSLLLRVDEMAEACMRLKSFQIENVDHIRKLAVDNLSDVVVIAGPNGVGKSRAIRALIDCLREPGRRATTSVVVEATSEFELVAWKKPLVDTKAAGDANLLQNVLRRSQKRNQYRSTILNFESDRAVRNVAAYGFSWDIPDPDEEEVGWDLGYGFLRDRFTDVQHTIFRRLESQRRKIASDAVKLREGGATSMALNFPDPLKPFKIAFSRLLAPKKLLNADIQNQRLTYEDRGKALSINSLSSGEREVVNIAFDFIIRNPSDCIIFFDEPELHLHPELSYKLLQVLANIGKNNQFIFCTHSPEIITASLENTVIFLSPNREGLENQAIVVGREDETNQALSLLGQSIGIISLGKKLVLIEGNESSLDKQTYGAILKDEFPDYVLVPVGGKHTIRSFNDVRESVLNKTIWGVEFFLLADRDASYQLGIKSTEHNATPRMKVLPRYHIENYFLDEAVLASAFTHLESEGHWLRSAAEIRTRLRDLARGLIPYAVALKVAATGREAVGHVDLLAKGVAAATSADELVTLLKTRVQAEMERVRVVLDSSAIEQAARLEYQRLTDSIEADTLTWRADIPGRLLLNKFAGLAGINVGRLKRLYLAAAQTGESDPFAEILTIFREFAATR